MKIENIVLLSKKQDWDINFSYWTIRFIRTIARGKPEIILASRLKVK